MAAAEADQAEPAAADRPGQQAEATSAVPDDLQALVIGRRFELLQQWQAQPRTRRREFLEQVVLPGWVAIPGIEQCPALAKVPTASAVYKLHKRMRERGKEALLGYHVPRKVRRSGCIPEEGLAYIRKQRFVHAGRVTLIHDAYLKEARRHGWPRASYRTILRCINAIPDDIIYLADRGVRDYRAQRAPFIQRDERELQPHQYLNGDHHQFDLLVRCIKTGKLFRPWLTAWQDVRSRAVPGWTINPTPNSKTILMALAASIEPVNRPGCELMCGLPDGLLTDNGKDYRSKALCGAMLNQGDKERLRGIFETLEIDDVRNVLPYMPSSKPIERFFLEVAEGFSALLPGYVASNPRDRRRHELGKLRKQHEAFLRCERQQSPFLTMAELAPLFEQWLFGYHQRSHETLSSDGRQMSPIDVYQLYGQAREMPTTKALLYIAQESCARTIQKNGVQLDDRWFWSPELFNHTGRVEVRRDPVEAGRVHVYTLAGKYLCEAISAGLLRTGASPEQVKDEMRRKRDTLRARQAYLKELVQAAPPDGLTLREAMTVDIPPPPAAPVKPEAITRLMPEFDRIGARQLQPPAEPPAHLTVVPAAEPEPAPKRFYALAADRDEDEDDYAAVVAAQE